MTTFHVVTTCNARGWEEYGRRMAASFGKFWPFGQRLNFYVDGYTPAWPIVDPSPLPAWQVAFKSKHRGDPDARGMARGSYDFKRDAVKFSHKVAAITDAAEHSYDDVLIWLDGDTLAHSKVTQEWLESLIPPDAALSWLDRDGMYPETGVMLFRLGHPKCAQLMDRMREMYESSAIFGLPETHDAYVFQHVVRALTVPWHSLSGYARNCSHPVAQGPLSAVFDHRKGARKALDHSPEHVVLT